MAEKNKLIPFSEELETAIQQDADRCRRPFVRQVEAILLTYYGLEDVELKAESLEMIGELAPLSKTKKLLLETGAAKKKRTA